MEFCKVLKKLTARTKSSYALFDDTVLWPLYRLHPYVPWNPISLVQICWHNTASTSRHNTTSNEKYTMKFAVTTCLTILFGSLLHASVRVDGLQRSDNVSYYHMKACLTAKRARQRWEEKDCILYQSFTVNAMLPELFMICLFLLRHGPAPESFGKGL